MFYAVERWVDGFGADTWVDCIFETEKEANEYIEKIVKKGYAEKEGCAVVPCEFGKPIKQYWG